MYSLQPTHEKQKEREMIKELLLLLMVYGRNVSEQFPIEHD